MKDNLLRFIEVWSGRIHGWAWDKRWKYRDSKEWAEGYKKWKTYSIRYLNYLKATQQGKNQY